MEQSRRNFLRSVSALALCAATPVAVLASPEKAIEAGEKVYIIKYRIAFATPEDEAVARKQCPQMFAS